MSWEDQIADYLKTHVDGLQTCQRYSGEFDADSVAAVSFRAPAVFVACLGWAKAKQQPGDGRTALQVRFAAFIVADKPTKRNPNTDIVALSLAITAAIEGKTLGVNVAHAAELQRAESGANAKLDKKGLALWAITWTQVIYQGESNWSPEGTVPTEVLFSYAPHVGTPHEHDYTSVLEVSTS